MCVGAYGGNSARSPDAAAACTSLRPSAESGVAANAAASAGASVVGSCVRVPPTATIARQKSAGFSRARHSPASARP